MLSADAEQPNNGRQDVNPGNRQTSFSVIGLLRVWYLPISATLRSRVGAVGGALVVLTFLSIRWSDSANVFGFLLSATLVSVTATLVLIPATFVVVVSLPLAFIDEIARAGSEPANVVCHGILRMWTRARAAVVRSRQTVTRYFARAESISASVDRSLDTWLETARALLLLVTVVLLAIFVLGGLVGLLLIGWRALSG